MKAVVLLSAGLDSTTLLAKAVKEFGAENINALCLSYGQKHNDKEINSAYEVAKYYNVPLVHEVVDCFKFSTSTLLTGRDDIEHSSYVEQTTKLDGAGAVATYVPFRNGLFLSIAAAYAYSIDAEFIFYGAHSDDAAGSAYPDCTELFVEYMRNAIFEGTGNKVTLRAPFISMTKADIVKEGLELNVPYELTWSCYEGNDKPCGTCGTCIDRIKAFEENGVIDPLMK